MNLNYVYEFIILAETGSITGAAKRLSIPQPTLTKHMQMLEASLGTTLLSRGKQSVAINEFGELFLPYARRLIEEKNAYTRAFEEYHTALNIGAIKIIAHYGITDMLFRFKLENPDIEVNITESDELNLKELLLQGQFDIVFVREPGSVIVDEELEKITCAADTIVAILPAAHPLAGEKSLELRQLREENFFLLARQSPMYKLCISACHAAGFEPRIAGTGFRGPNIFDFVSRGSGVSLLTKRLVERYHGRDHSVVAVDVVPALQTNVTMLYCKNRKTVPMIDRFLQFYRTYAAGP